jgi:hypothetical protein
MTEQLSLLPPEPAAQAVKGAERFAVCRARVDAGCDGHHEPGPLFAGIPIMRWICCADCPVRGEVAAARAEAG